MLVVWDLDFLPASVVTNQSKLSRIRFPKKIYFWYDSDARGFNGQIKILSEENIYKVFTMQDTEALSKHKDSAN